MNIIELKNITKRFNERLALDNISLNVEEGEIFGLIGPNGAGKSTLINILIGLLPKDSGTISILSKDFEKNIIEIKSNMGLVPQELALMKGLNAQLNLEYFGAFYGLSGKLLKERVKEALDIVGLTDRKKDKVQTFSGGMLRRLNLGAAIMHHPKILILDEPTVGVDPQSRNYIFEYLRRINKETGTTIIYTSHYMEEVEALCNKIFIIDEGREIAYGTSNQIKAMVKDSNVLEIELDESEENLQRVRDILQMDNLSYEEGKYRVKVKDDLSMEEIIARLHKEGLKLKGIAIKEPKLEEVFLNLTGKKLRD